MNDYNTKFRPDDLEGFVGNEHVVKALEPYIDDPDTIPHSILLTGPSGVGKTTLARIIALALGLDETDSAYHEVDAASFSGIDSMRSLIRGMEFSALGASGRKVFVIDECHALSKAAWQALLKPIEEPPPHVYFILATTELGKVPKTIKTRCTSFDLKEVPEPVLVDLIMDVVDQEELDLDETLVEIIAKESGGSPRQALTLLQVGRNARNKKELMGLIGNASSSPEVIDLCRMLVRGDSRMEDCLKLVSKIKDENLSPESIRLQVLLYMNSVVLGNNTKSGTIEKALRVMDEFSHVCNPSEKMAPITLAVARVFF